jgi:sugar/nucleoside kinase (ribokinase family)
MEGEERKRMAVDVIAAGELYIDLVMTGLDRWPQPGEEAFARDFWRGPGGGAAITAIGLAKLGVWMGLAGAVGEDGGWLRENIGRCGVDTSEVRAFAGEMTGTTASVSNEADRGFFTFRGANRRLPEVARDAMFAARHLHWAGPVPRDLMDRVHGMTVSLDVGFSDATDETMNVLPWIDLFFPNLVEGERMTGEREPEKILRAFAKARAKTVVLKLGKAGSAMLVDSRLLIATPPDVTSVDTTGAGDCFDAGFLFSWLNGKNPEECLRTGNLCGALSTRALGGIAAFPSLEELA